MVIWRRWVIAASRNFAFKIPAKPLQVETWLLLTAYKNASSPCHRPPLTTYCLVTILSVTDEKRTDDTSYPGFFLAVSQNGR